MTSSDVPPLPAPPPALVQSAEPRRESPTGRPPLGLHRGGLVEAVVFAAEYPKAHPGERAELVLPRLRAMRQPISATVRYTRDGRSFLHPAWPEPAPGEPWDSQLRRALARLQDAGVPSRLVDGAEAGRIGPHLVLEFQGLQFGWCPRLGLGYYNGLGDPPAKNSVVEGIEFVLRYRARHPREKAFAYVHPLPEASTPGRMVATAVYTRDGRAYAHHLLTGDLPLSLKPGELKDEPRVVAAASREYRARRDAQRAGRRTPPKPGEKPRPPPDYSCETLAGELSALDLPARVEAGALRFEWMGRSYAYTPERGCFLAP